MVGKLHDLVVPILESLGYQRGWGLAVVDRIRQQIPVDVGRLALRQQNIDDVLNCGGLWQGKEDATELPATVFMLRHVLIVRVTKEFLAASLAGVAIEPLVFVRSFLGTETNFDPLTATWLLLQNELQRLELESELALAIGNLVEEWPGIVDPSKVSLGSVVDEFAFGDVVLSVDNVDVTFGEHRDGEEVNWPGAVLVRFVPQIPHPQDLEEMALGALVHGIAMGCPPQRLVVWGLQSGRGIGMDVEREWLELTIGAVRVAVKAIADMRQDRGMQLSSGPHCGQCPLGHVCEISEANEPPF